LFAGGQTQILRFAQDDNFSGSGYIAPLWMTVHSGGSSSKSTARDG
jgi:hypothetical protein